MQRKTLIAVLVFAAMCVAPSYALAQFAVMAGPGPGGPVTAGPVPMPLMIAINKAGLSPDQQTKVHQIMQANFTQAEPLMQQLHSVHDQISDKLMSASSVTTADLAPLQQKESEIHQQLDQQMVATAVQIRSVLTADQLAKAADLHSKLKSLRAQMDALVGEGGLPLPPPPGF